MEQNKNKNKENGISKDWAIAAVTAIGFFAVLQFASWVDSKYNFAEIFNLVGFYTVVAKVAIASALAWTVKKIIFAKTLGKDFGKTFNDAWDAMYSKDKVKWILITFLALFVTIMFNFQ